MTDTERTDALKTVEKKPHQSKKFLAWLIANLLLSAMAIVALVKQPELGWPLASFMVAIVFSMCASTMLLIGKQAALDTAVRGFAMLGKSPSNILNKIPGMGKKGVDDSLPDQ